MYKNSLMPYNVERKSRCSSASARATQCKKRSLAQGWCHHSLCSWLVEQENLTDAKQRSDIKAVCCICDCYLVENDKPPARGDNPTADQPSTVDVKVICCLS